MAKPLSSSSPLTQDKNSILAEEDLLSQILKGAQVCLAGFEPATAILTFR